MNFSQNNIPKLFFVFLLIFLLYISFLLSKKYGDVSYRKKQNLLKMNQSNILLKIKAHSLKDFKEKYKYFNYYIFDNVIFLLIYLVPSYFYFSSELFFNIFSVYLLFFFFMVNESSFFWDFYKYQLIL